MLPEESADESLAVHSFDNILMHGHISLCGRTQIQHKVLSSLMNNLKRCG